MSDSSGTTDGEVGGPGSEPIRWEPPIASPALSPLETLGDGTSTDVLPETEPRAPRSKRPWLIGTAVAAVLVLLLGGVAAALLLNRPDVKLQRALSATTDRPTGSRTMSLRVGLQVVGNADASMQQLLGTGAMRVAWDKASDTQQYVLTVKGKNALDVVVGPDSVIVAQDLAALGIPEAQSILSGLGDMAASLGPDGKALVYFSNGAPLRIPTGPDSAFGTLVKAAAGVAGAKAGPDDAKVQAIADKVQQSVRDHVTVTDVGSDDSGDHLRATIPVKAVVRDVAPSVAELAGRPLPDDYLSSIEGEPQVSLDVWVKDGVVSRVEVPLSDLMRATGGDSSTPDVTLVVEMSDQGVVMPSGTVVDLPDSIFDSLGGGLFGGLGGFGAGPTSGLDSGFGTDSGVDSGSSAVDSL